MTNEFILRFNYHKILLPFIHIIIRIIMNNYTYIKITIINLIDIILYKYLATSNYVKYYIKYCAILFKV